MHVCVSLYLSLRAIPPPLNICMCNASLSQCATRFLFFHSSVARSMRERECIANVHVRTPKCSALFSAHFFSAMHFIVLYVRPQNVDCVAPANGRFSPLVSDTLCYSATLIYFPHFCARLALLQLEIKFGFIPITFYSESLKWPKKVQRKMSAAEIKIRINLYSQLKKKSNLQLG